MAKMSIDTFALRDPRVRKLARSLASRFGADVREWPDFARRYTLGVLLEVWALSYDRLAGVLEPDDVNDVAAISHFVDEMIVAGLGRNVDDGVYVTGSAERLAKALGLRKQTSKAGQRSGEVRRRKREVVNKRRTERRTAVEQPGNEHLSSYTEDEGVFRSSPTSGPGPDPVVAASRESAISGGNDAADAVARVLRRFGDRTLERHGVRPSIRALNKAVRRGLAELVAEHGEAEMLRRADIAIDTPPEWPPERPWTIAMFVTHNDRLVSNARSNGVAKSKPGRMTFYDAVQSMSDRPIIDVRADDRPELRNPWDDEP